MKEEDIGPALLPAPLTGTLICSEVLPSGRSGNRGVDRDQALAVVAGSPKPASHRLDAAVWVASGPGPESPAVVIDVVSLGTGLFEWQTRQQAKG